MIRLSVKEDYEGLVKLWLEAFGDSEEAIRMFLDSRFVPENTVVSEDNGRIVSMLFLLEGGMKINNKLFHSYYLYAAATAKSHRGRGIMANLLAYASEVAQSRDIDFICLKPAEQRLYDYYARFGYKTVFASKIVRINDFSETGFPLSPSCNDVTDFSVIRDASLSETDAFIWDNSAIEFAIRQHLFYGGKVFYNRKGHCLYSVESNECYVKEICFTDIELDIIVSFLKSLTDADEVLIELPVNAASSEYDYEIRNNGMALAVSDSAESIIDNIKNAYLNLTLD